MAAATARIGEPTQSRRAAAGPGRPRDAITRELTAEQRALLGDLFAVIEEHATDPAASGDRARRSSAPSPSPARATPARSASPARTSSPIRSGSRGSAPGMRLDTATLCAALLHDTVEDTSASLEEVRERVRRGDRPARRRRHQADRDHLPEPRRAPGRELPQDDGGDGHRRQGDPDQAGRPPPQHAHAGRAGQAEAA